MSFGAKLLKLRTRLEFSQAQLAKAFGVAGRFVICRWEIGTREPVETVQRLVLLLNDLPKEKALELISRLESYEKR